MPGHSHETSIQARQRQQELERERIRLRNTVESLKQVIGVIGHELRTPLAALRASCEMLVDPVARQFIDVEKYLDSINRQIVQLSDMVNRMLEAARINCGAIHWQWSTFDLASVCDQALQVTRPLLTDDAVEMRRDVPADLRMAGDPEAICRLLVNLIRNAQKHTTRGQIVVSARQAFVEDIRWIELSVQDTGQGISPDLHDKLGQPFAPGGGRIGTTPTEGAGLGLAICKGIALAHGGQIKLTTAPGNGTKVTVWLLADLPGPEELSDVECGFEVRS